MDWAGNCGNLSAAVGPFAVDEGMLSVDDGGDDALVRIYQTNTDAVLTARVPLEADRRGRTPIARASGDCRIGGVPGTGAPVELDFGATAGTVLGRGLLPTGRPVDRLALADGRLVDATIVDAGTPTVFVREGDIEVDDGAADEDARQAALERVRGAACVALGLAARAADAATTTPYLPFVAAVGPPRRTGADLESRLSLMQRPHRAYPVTGAVATGAAARIPGTLVREALGTGAAAARDAAPVRIGHPTGVLEIDVGVDAEREGGPELTRAVLLRTARRLMDGFAYI